MKQRTAALVAGSFLVAACSLINSTEDLKPVAPPDPTGAAGSGGEPGGEGGTANPAGGRPAGGEGGGDVSGAGVAGCGIDGCGDGGESGAPPIGRECDDSAADCGSTAPICDAAGGMCRACSSDDECSADLGLDFCSKSGPTRGRCIQCRTDEECTVSEPVCGNAGQCRPCTAHAECRSNVCMPTGECAPEARAVYVLAETGSSAATCGTLDEPCRNMENAAAKLTADRPNLVLLATTEVMRYGGVALPALPGLPPLRVIGNGVLVQPYDGTFAFSVPAGVSVLFDDVVLEGSLGNAQGEDPMGNPVAAIRCSGGQVTIQNSVLRGNASGLIAQDCDVTVVGSLIEGNAAAAQYNGGGIVARCAGMGCTKKFEVRRNRFVDNGVAAYNYGQAEAVYENNLFLRNGADGYTRVIELRAAHTRFAYNTLVENFNGCSYVGIVACDEGVCEDIANISYRSFPDEMEPCYDQVWYNGTISYSLTEIAYPGSTNRVGDPLFVDADNGDFTPGPGSPAIDHGKPNDAPAVDIDGRPRPPGSPDIGAFEAP